MSHFVRCDRCYTQDATIGTISLPPGWQKICGADLCEPCCMMVRDFIRFRPGDADRLPVEPIEQVESDSPVSDKLFEVAPQVSADSPPVSGHASNGEPVPTPATDGDPEGQTQPESAESIPAEVSAEERARERKTKKRRMRGQDAILPDPRPPAPGASA